MSPPEEELVICAMKCFEEGKLQNGLEAYKTTDKTPPKEKRIECANICMVEKRKADARKAMVEANKIQD
ncbi:MAG: hypothetical protein M8352_07990 [ANME-2 cluster archaeon]|nr:hypothetical protein [ANME-2 cluster archaeon]MDF1532597.1 hypothetical protein [ANME-2 cluster archaeon]